MMLKLLGCVMLISTGGFAAFQAAALEKKKLSVTEGWLELLFYIRTRIDCHLTPIEQIFEEVTQGSGHDTQEGFLCLEGTNRCNVSSCPERAEQSTGKTEPPLTAGPT